MKYPSSDGQSKPKCYRSLSMTRCCARIVIKGELPPTFQTITRIDMPLPPYLYLQASDTLRAGKPTLTSILLQDTAAVTGLEQHSESQETDSGGMPVMKINSKTNNQTFQKHKPSRHVWRILWS
ncbi:uncharacterized protein LOC133636001 isoform X4 [Entelurus aequoreus]|uniref:uncharacterized protein LOC133636001 isoform X4 n=1 Tax=Entelurus aequoreus TaxID=161455 RepID=UPI002B1E54C2|nr:uncharacterized protein LOC133636001 isoform X4 [Entelurus aequoreus]XP_061885556.1 uncharacterized protein LOC133636001 isoform X4 [Entelurus aequoreus]